MGRLDDKREYLPIGRNTALAAQRLVNAKEDELRLIVRRDPSMIRDVALELLRMIGKYEP